MDFRTKKERSWRPAIEVTLNGMSLSCRHGERRSEWSRGPDSKQRLPIDHRPLDALLTDAVSRVHPGIGGIERFESVKASAE